MHIAPAGDRLRKSVRVPAQPPFARLDPELLGRSVLNALQHKEDLGWAEITHPYHPFRDQRFKILKTRKVAGEDTIILQGSYRGTFAVPREWTDQADPSSYDQLDIRAPILCFRRLLTLAELIEQIGKEGLDK